MNSDAGTKTKGTQEKGKRTWLSPRWRGSQTMKEEATNIAVSGTEAKRERNGRNHLYENCSYLHESIRPQGWIPNQAVLDKIAKNLEENSRLKHYIENCKKRIAGKTEDASKDATVRRSRNSTDKEKEGQADDDLTLIRRSWVRLSPKQRIILRSSANPSFSVRLQQNIFAMINLASLIRVPCRQTR
jgi:hypothetical protein